MEHESETARMFYERDSSEPPPPPNPIVPPVSNPSPPPRSGSQSKRPTPPRPRGRPPGSATKPKKAPEQKDYRTPLLGIGQLAAAPCLLAGQALKRPEFIADGAAITTHTPPIADAINQLAHDDPQVAAILDRLLVIGPYGALLAAIMPLVAQIVTNHRKEVLPVTQAFGAVDPDVLISALIETVEVSPNGDATSQTTSGSHNVSP